MRFLCLLLPAVLLSTVVGCKKKEAPSTPTHSVQADGTVRIEGPSKAYLRVEPVRGTSGEADRSLVARVSFDERRVARLGSQVAGRISEVRVVTGDVVKKGDSLLTVRAADVAGAQAQLADAKTTRVLAEREAERAKRLLKEGAGSEAEVLKSESALELAKAEENRAQAALGAIGGAGGSASYVVRSPIDGTVVESNAAVGGQVTDALEKPLVIVADLVKVWILADVYEQDLPFVQTGNPVVVRVLAFPERHFDGKLGYVSEVMDQGTRSATARIELDNPERILRPGMLASVEARGISRGSLEIPTSALLTRRDQYFVFVQRDDGAYEQREVTVAEQRGQHTVLLSGVRLGENVVVEGAILLDAEANEAL